MFTGIVESIGKIVLLKKEKSNLHITVESNLTPELKIDQSISHNGVCLTVVSIENNCYTITAIKETLEKSNLGTIRLNDSINLERAMRLGDRLDGHMVQGHVDQTGVCTHIEETEGSWLFTFSYTPINKNITIEKGSITVNGVSLTVINSNKNDFSVAIIPYTFEHTNFKYLKLGDTVNLEFDVIGKYVMRIMDVFR
ncbi:MAG: riboflavin synthase [Flavobacteriaceae bacterium]